ncbi:DUF2075 domain-containing protein [Sphingobacterium sp. DN00404]|uniref:DUF2075 domain-containing protein n=1 Tax=Sphingobacterium micropteri TaxID=2763501 RepID=A0ABR7YUK3_9SPHI|nr:DNA/RNA helicase domain-containing protein [Sphingobacterium micropteri]MBD1434967.1 DUF2075 domain-containing protein [Sphingobacterium micropteri]
MPGTRFRWTSLGSGRKSGEVAPNVLLMDESHRIREKTRYPFKPTGRLQVEDLLRAARISVFFIDDYQVVRKG